MKKLLFPILVLLFLAAPLDKVQAQESSSGKPLLRISQEEIPADSTVLQTAADTIQDTVELTINLLGTHTILPKGVPGQADNRVLIRVYRPEESTSLAVELESRSARNPDKNVTLREETASVMGLFDLAEEMARRYLSVLMDREIRFVPFRIVNSGDVQGEVTVLIDGNPAPMEVGEAIKVPQGVYPVVIQQERIWESLTLKEEEVALLAPEDGGPPPERVLEFTIPGLTGQEEEEIRQIRWILSQYGAEKRSHRESLLALLALLESNPASSRYQEEAEDIKETAAWKWETDPSLVQRQVKEYINLYVDSDRPTMAAFLENKKASRWHNYPGNLRIHLSGGGFAFFQGAMSDGSKLLPVVNTGLHYRLIGPVSAGAGAVTLINKGIPFHIPGFLPLPYGSVGFHQSLEMVHRLDVSAALWGVPYVLAGYSLDIYGFTAGLYGYFDWATGYKAGCLTLGYSVRF